MRGVRRGWGEEEGLGEGGGGGVSWRAEEERGGGKEGKRERGCIPVFCFCCRSTIDDVKREHEADRQHLIRMHNEEVEALKAAHSHSRWGRVHPLARRTGLASKVNYTPFSKLNGRGNPSLDCLKPSNLTGLLRSAGTVYFNYSYK